MSVKLPPYPLSGQNPSTTWFRSGHRITDFRFDMFNHAGFPLGPLEGVQSTGSVSWKADASIAGGGKITVQNMGQSIDWLGIRIKPVAIVSSVEDESMRREVPLGEFLPSAPTDKWDDSMHEWPINLVDKCSILDEDTPANPSTGELLRYSAKGGTKIIDNVRWLIALTGERAFLPDYPDVLDKRLTWNMGTPTLKVINDLLEASGFYPIWCDLDGKFRVEKYVEPHNRPVHFWQLNPLIGGPESVVDPSWTHTSTVTVIPNRMAVFQQGTGSLKGRRASAVNTNPMSPYSRQARGRWITEVEGNVDAVSQAALDAYAKRKLQELSQAASIFKIQHLMIPGLQVRSVLKLQDSGAHELRAEITDTSIPFDPLSLCKTTMKQVVEP